MKNLLVLIFLLAILTISCTEEKQINIIGENASNLRALNSLVPEYQKKNDIKIKYHPYSFGDAMTKTMVDLNDTTARYDIFMQYNFLLSSLVKGNHISKLEHLVQGVPAEKLEFENDLFENAWKEIGYYSPNPDSALEKIGYPFASNTMILSYNKDLFNNLEIRKSYFEKYKKELKVPDTWQEYLNIAEFFTMPEKNLYGVCLQGAEGGWLYYEYCNFLFGMGGTVMKKKYGWESYDSSSIYLNSAEAIKATKLYVSLKPYNYGDYLTIGAYEQIKLMKQGNVAMSIIWSDLAVDLIEGENGKDDRFQFAPIPGNVSGLAGGAFFINKDSKKKKESINYIVDMLQKENQVKLLQKGLCSTLRTAYEDPICDNIPYADALKESLNRGVYMFEAGIDADLISQKITNYIQKIWKGELKVKIGLDKLQKEVINDRKKLF